MAEIVGHLAPWGIEERMFHSQHELLNCTGTRHGLLAQGPNKYHWELQKWTRGLGGLDLNQVQDD